MFDPDAPIVSKNAYVFDEDQPIVSKSSRFDDEADTPVPKPKARPPAKRKPAKDQPSNDLAAEPELASPKATSPLKEMPVPPAQAVSPKTKSPKSAKKKASPIVRGNSSYALNTLDEQPVGLKSSLFDEQPIRGNGQASVMEEQAATEEENDTRPILERIGDKNWKTRNNAYEALRNEIQSQTVDPQFFNDFGPWLAKMTSDSNATAIDTGFDAAVVFVDAAPESVALQYVEKLFINAVDKSFSANKSSMQAKGKALLLKCMEINDPLLCTKYLLTRLADKKPKVPAMCLEVIKDGMALFGIKGFPVKEVIKAIGPTFESSNGPTREVAMALLLEIYRWIGKAPIASLVDSLRPAQKLDFEKLEVELKGKGATPAPTLYTRKERPAEGSIMEATVDASASATSKVKIAHAGIDAREYVEEVDLGRQLKSTEYAKLVVEEKWSDQLKALQLVIDTIGPTPKIKSGSDVHDIVAVCKGFLRQGHVQLQVASLKILSLLADGMRADFASMVRPLTQAIVHKTKEKRLVPDVASCLQMILKHCLTFDSIVEDVLEGVRSKKEPVHTKIALMELITHAIQTLPEKINKDTYKSIAEALVLVCEDSDPKVRDVSSTSLVELASFVKSKGKSGNDANKVFLALEQTHPRIFKKIQQASATSAGAGDDSASLASSSKPASHQPPPSAASGAGSNLAKTSAVASSRPTTASSSGMTSSAASLASSKPRQTAKPGAAASKHNVPSSVDGAAHDEQVEELGMNAQEATDFLAGLDVPEWQSAVLPNMDSAKWQDKVDSLKAIEMRLKEANEGGKYSAALVTFLADKTNGFKISNLNIMKAVITCCTAAAQFCGEGEKFSKSAAWEAIKQFGDKLADKKNKEIIFSLLTALSQVVSATFVVNRMKVIMDKTKAPLAHEYYLQWLKEAIVEFGATSFPIKNVGVLCQEAMENKVAAVRTSAIEVMGSLYYQVGPKLLAIAISNDMKPQTRDLLQAEFTKVGYDPVAAAAKAALNPASNTGTGIPRQDLATLLDKNILNELNLVEGKTSWQNRKAAMEAIVAACDRSGHFLESSKPTLELVKSLKARIHDTQANLKPIAVAAIGHVIASLEVDAGCKALKFVAGGLISGLGDNKKPMRDATVTALQCIVSSNREPSNPSASAEPLLLSALIIPISEALTNVVGRIELLVWLQGHADTIRSGDDLLLLLTGLINCMQDKTAAVRATAEQITGVLTGKSLITKAALEKATRDLPPAVKRTMQPSIDRMIQNYGTLVATAVAPPLLNSLGPQPKSQPIKSADLVQDELEMIVPDLLLATEREDAKSPLEMSSAPVPPIPMTLPPAPLAPTSASLSTLPLPLPPSHAMSPLRTKHGAAQTAPMGSSSSIDSAVSAYSSPPASIGGSTRRARVRGAPGTPEQKAEPSKAHASPMPNGKSKSPSSTIPLHPNRLNSSSSSTISSSIDLSDQLSMLSADTFDMNCSSQWCLRKTATGKFRRLEEFYKLNWPQPPAEVGANELAALKVTWDPLIEPALSAVLFPVAANQSVLVNQDMFVAGIEKLSEQILCPYLVPHVDLILRWCACVLAQKETFNLSKLLQFVIDLFSALRAQTTTLHDSEVLSILPHLVDKCGHKSERARSAFKDIFAIASDIIVPNKLLQHFVQGLGSVNKKSRLTCIEEIQRIVSSAGVASLGRSGMKDIGSVLEAKDNDFTIKSALLDLVFLLYQNLSYDVAKVIKLMGAGLSDKGILMVKDAITQRSKYQLGATQAIAGPKGPSPSKSLPQASGTPGRPTQSPFSKQTAAIEASSPPGISSTITNSINKVASRDENGNPLSIVPVSYAEELKKTFFQSPNSRGCDFSLMGIANLMDDTPKSRAQNKRGFSGELLESSNSPIGRPVPDPGPALFFAQLKRAMDAYLQCSWTMRLSNAEAVYALAIESIKILQTMATSQWFSDREKLQAPSELYPQSITEESFLEEGESLVGLLCMCIDSSFGRSPSFIPTDFKAGFISRPPSSQTEIDSQMAAAVLSAMYAMVKRVDLIEALSYTALSALLRQCLVHISDERLLNTNPADEEMASNAQQMIRALNMIVLKLTQNIPTCPVLCCLLELIFLCIPAQEVYHKNCLLCLPQSSTKPTSRLIVKILTDESKKPLPYLDESFDLRALILAIHNFFSRHPANASDDTPFRTVKTVLNEVIKSVGAAKVLGMLQAEATIPATSFVYLLTTRLGNVQAQPVSVPVEPVVSGVRLGTTTSSERAASASDYGDELKENAEYSRPCNNASEPTPASSMSFPSSSAVLGTPAAKSAMAAQFIAAAVTDGSPRDSDWRNSKSCKQQLTSKKTAKLIEQFNTPARYTAFASPGFVSDTPAHTYGYAAADPTSFLASTSRSLSSEASVTSVAESVGSRSLSSAAIASNNQKALEALKILEGIKIRTSTFTGTSLQTSLETANMTESERTAS